ncbi:MAG: glycoside hydrolase family 2 protein [Xanthomonadales bacterium]|nr:glycoside hydrolase family 2 protein [Xanthomonadales bacterium]
MTLRNWLGLALATTLSLSAQAKGGANGVSMQHLDGAWTFRLQPDDAQAASHRAMTTWRRATVPGTVHTDLLANHRIPDPYVGAPEAGLQWIGLAGWEYRRGFDVDATALRASRNELVFQGLDTLADVWLNGERILSADNSFRTWRIPVHGKLKAHGNILRVVFHSPIATMLPQVQAMPHKIAGNYTSPYGDEPKDAMTANFVRKPGYHYGWDWGPRYVTAGIWQPVSLQSWSGARIDDLQIRQDHVDGDRAELTARVRIDPAAAAHYRVRLWQVAPDGRRTAAGDREVDAATTTTVDIPVHIEHPQRWYPNGYGAQPLYRFEAEVLANGRVTDRFIRRTGLRSVELRREKDASGRSFEFVVNGIPVFAKGANSIPFDMFAPRPGDAQIRRTLQSARDANMNMLRSWGGGYYERDAFFDAADELGLMVWQDFMFGGGMQPAWDPAFRANVVAEARDQLQRLRNHPSIVLWCGNNEEEIAWKYWGHGKELGAADPVFAKKVWDGWQQLFDHDLRNVVQQEGGGIAYWPSSPSADDLAGKADINESGDRHYWEVWGGPAYPYEKYLEITPRFMSEYGLQAWPEMRTIRAFAGKGPLAIDSPVITAHQKFMAGKGNERLMHYIAMEYGTPRDFADFVYLSQVMQMDGISLAALHHRASRPVTMGSLYWQLNDVWPGASWSGIDWFGRWKPLNYAARRFYAPVAVAALRQNGRTTVTLLSDRTTEHQGQLRTRLFDLDGKLLRDETTAVKLPPLSASVAMTLDDAQLLRGIDAKRTVAAFDLYVDGEPASRGVVYFAHAKDIAWPDPGLHRAWSRDGKTLRLTATRFARGVWVDFGDLDATLSDNAFTLLPGETITLQVRSDASPNRLQTALQVRSLADALSSTPPSN